MIETVKQLIDALQPFDPTSPVRVNSKFFISGIPPSPTDRFVNIAVEIPRCPPCPETIKTRETRNNTDITFTNIKPSALPII